MFGDYLPLIAFIAQELVLIIGVAIYIERRLSKIEAKVNEMSKARETDRTELRDRIHNTADDIEEHRKNVSIHFPIDRVIALEKGQERIERNQDRDKREVLAALAAIDKHHSMALKDLQKLIIDRLSP